MGRTQKMPSLQEAIAASEARVAIPYARLLAQVSDPGAVRMRRDFPALLAYIRAHALLHQRRRDRDQAGRIVATLGDYVAVHGLVGGLISEAVERTVPPTVRETVDAVHAWEMNAPDQPPTVEDLARRLGRHRSTVWRRARVAIKLGYLESADPGRRRLRVRTAAQMPQDRQTIPTPDELTAKWEETRRAQEDETG